MSQIDKRFRIFRNDCKDSYAIATYLVESPLKPEDAAFHIAMEQSLTPSALYFLDDNEVINKYAAKVVQGSIETIKETKHPALITNLNIPGNVYSQFSVQIAYPICNFGGMLSTMYNTIIGEIHNIGVLTGIKVLDIDFPSSYLANFKGPAFGVSGIRQILGEKKSPIFMGPVKPCVGLNSEQFARRAYDVAKGGFHIVKDDELIVETSYSKFADRIKETVKLIRQAESEAGKRKMYFPHIGGDAARVDGLFEIAMNEGADGVMLSPAINGVDIINKFRGKAPMIAHNTLMYASSRHPLLGIKFSLWAKLQRIAGADIMLNPAPLGSFDVVSKCEHQDNIDACLKKLNSYKPIFPALSGSQSPASLALYYNCTNNSDFIMVAGSAAYNHPMGAEAGAKSFIQMWEALSQGLDPALYANDYEELKVSLENFKVLSSSIEN